jgi:hypothetical protein
MDNVQKHNTCRKNIDVIFSEHYSQLSVCFLNFEYYEHPGHSNFVCWNAEILKNETYIFKQCSDIENCPGADYELTAGQRIAM